MNTRPMVYLYKQLIGCKRATTFFIFPSPLLDLFSCPFLVFIPPVLFWQPQNIFKSSCLPFKLHACIRVCAESALRHSLLLSFQDQVLRKLKEEDLSHYNTNIQHSQHTAYVTTGESLCDTVRRIVNYKASNVPHIIRGTSREDRHLWRRWMDALRPWLVWVPQRWWP